MDVTTSARTISTPTLVRLFRGIDRLPPGANGALVFASPESPQGTVLIEDNRICWAAASNMGQRLTDILRHQSDPPLPAALFEEVYEECLATKTPLGEALLGRGLVTSRGLWSGLRQHTAEALALLATAEKLNPIWTSNRARRYQARFTFTTPELLCAVGALGFDRLAGEAESYLRDTTAEGTAAFGFVASDGHRLPIAQVAGEDWDSGALVELGEWAKRAVAAEPDRLIEGRVPVEGGVSTRAAWQVDELVFVRWNGRPMVPAAPGSVEELFL